MNKATTRGIVFAGEGVGSQYVKISWARKQIREKLGFDPYLGTLNIRLPNKQAKLLENTLKKFEGVGIKPERGFFRAHCFTALIMNKIKGAIVIPEKPDYPSNVLEIIAPVHLRKALALKDGDEVEITIFMKAKIKA
jgi:riboflavin kinase